MRKSVVLYWSGGKDSVMALHQIRESGRYRDYAVRSLLTTLTRGYDRVTGHGVRRELVQRQAACLGLDLIETYIPQRSSMARYLEVIEDALRREHGKGTRVAASGDIFVEKQRMESFRRTGMRGCFPLLQRDSVEHAREVVELGFKAIVVCVDSSSLDASFAGRLIDHQFLSDLPTGIDPCGENGEYHSFVLDGPNFSQPVRCRPDAVVEREGFYFCELVES